MSHPWCCNVTRPRSGNDDGAVLGRSLIGSCFSSKRMCSSRVVRGDYCTMMRYARDDGRCDFWRFGREGRRGNRLMRKAQGGCRNGYTECIGWQRTSFERRRLGLFSDSVKRDGCTVQSIAQEDGNVQSKNDTNETLKDAEQNSPRSGPPGALPAEVKYPVSLDVLPISSRVTLLRASCSSRLPEIQFSQCTGTTTNCYLIKTLASGDAEVLIDLPSKVYDYDMKLWLEELGALRTLKSIVLTRFNPERLPSFKKLLQSIPSSIQVMATKPALQLLEKMTENDSELMELLKKDNIDLVPITRSTELKLSDRNTTLRFVPIPTPRWPDLAAAYLPEEKLLFSSSFFAAHEAPAAGSISAFDEGGWIAHGEAWKFYFDCMLAPTVKQTATALDRLRINVTEPPKELGIFSEVLQPLSSAVSFLEGLMMGADDGTPEPLIVGTLCPIHGPVVRASLTELLFRYKEWTAEQIKATAARFVAVMYASAYGNTAALAQAISRGVTKAGIGVETLNLEVLSVEEVEAALQNCGGFVLGSPTLGGHMPTQVQTALGAILRSQKAKDLPCGVFGSFGWSGEAVDMMESRLKDGGFRFAFPTIRCKFKPTDAVLQQCEESGTDLAQSIKRAAKRREKTAAENFAASETVSAAAQALGRVVGTLCVVTSRQGDASSAMIASWVSQASFDPPGLTVAVKKDRAVESLLPINAKFVLNVLAEGREKPIMKQLLKPFSPGEDRFAGLDVKGSEKTGGIILPEAASYLECTVVQRLEAGDHWILYARVDDGNVLDDSALSAVHFRKSGLNY